MQSCVGAEKKIIELGGEGGEHNDISINPFLGTNCVGEERYVEKKKED